MDQVSCGLHWLTFSSKLPHHQVMKVMGGGFSQVEPLGKFNQPCSVGHESGARLYFGSDREGQPCVVNCPGQVCEGWANEALEWCLRSQAQVTRYDVALDLAPAEKARPRMLELFRAWRRKKVETRIDSLTRYLGEGEDGWTFRFGSENSDRFLRVYDRRGPLRFEWQVRPSKGLKPWVAKIIKEDGCASVWRSMSRDILFPMPWYRRLVEGDCSEWKKEAERTSTVKERMEQLRLQQGAELWALLVAGVKLDQLVREPAELKSRDVEKYFRWSRELRLMGYDGDRLEEALRCKLKRGQR